MPSDQKNNSQNQSEIDLLDLFSRLGISLKNALRNLFITLGLILQFLLKKWYYFFVAGFLAILCAFILNATSDSYYHSRITLRSNAATNQPIMSSIERLGEYTEEKNFASLAKELNLTLELAENIKDLEPLWFYDLGKDGIIDGIDFEGKYLSDTSVVKIDSVFSVRAEVFDPEALPGLQQGIIYYLENNAFLKSLNDQRISNLHAKKDQIEYEIEKLDSLQKREYYTNPDELRQKDGQIVFTAEKEVRIYHPQMFRLLQMKQDCERDINMYGDVVTVIEDFTIPIEPDNGTIILAKKLIWYFLGLGLLLAILITYRKKIFA